MTQPEKTTPIGESPSPHAEARRAFPAGLEQPEGSFRFSVDALLLAAFAASRTTDVTIRFIDLGTGCGVVGLAYLLLKRNICQGFGMDCNPELIAAAQNNTAKLGFSDRFALHTGELADTRFLENLRMEASPVQLVMANPPWRLVGSGRLPATEARRKALFGDKGTFRSLLIARRRWTFRLHHKPGQASGYAGGAGWGGAHSLLVTIYPQAKNFSGHVRAHRSP